MISALWTGISGLASQQAALDNESNNIANVNTVGYKASRVSFADLMYQNSIGKGSSVASVEKQYVQGGTTQTGGTYDMALQGDGFFVVSNTSSTGTSEFYYTRAGNFRMGEDGTLQDSNGNKVQGWALSTIETSDITSTNSNLSYFTDLFTEIAGNQIVQFSNRVETYAAKTTDYSESAKSDPTELTGSGVKTYATKVSDIEALITNYNNALESYASDPDQVSSPSVAQSTMIDFPDGSSSLMDSETDQIYVYINGDKVTQTYISEIADADFIAEMDAAGITTSGVTTTEEYNVLASKVATYKALADEISNITGLNAYTVDSSENASTSNVDVLEGLIKIDSIIPGESFSVGDVSEVAGTTETLGTSTTLVEAVKGTGEFAVESAMEALRSAIAGLQQDVFDETDILADDNDVAITFATGDTISYTLNGVTITSDNTLTTYEDAIADLITKINADTTLNSEVEAIDINGKLVIQAKTIGQDFSGILKFTDDSAGTTYTKEKNLDMSGNTGADAEFMQIISTIDQSASKSSLQLKLDSLGLTDSSFGEFSVDSNGLITMKQDGVEYAIGQVAIVQFTNNMGLESIGDNLLAKTNDSGEPIYSVNNDNGTSIEGEYLELSTADLSESLVNLMVFQRGFEANSKTITTADELLQTLINLKR